MLVVACIMADSNSGSISAILLISVALGCEAIVYRRAYGVYRAHLECLNGKEL